MGISHHRRGDEPYPGVFNNDRTSGPSDSWATVDCGLMPAEPHIRSPFPERLAPQSLILGTVRPPGSNGADQALVELAIMLPVVPNASASGSGGRVHPVFRHITATVCDGPPARIQRG